MFTKCTKNPLSCPNLILQMLGSCRKNKDRKHNQLGIRLLDGNFTVTSLLSWNTYYISRYIDASRSLDDQKKVDVLKFNPTLNMSYIST